jgi:hypothetical protein
MTRSRAKQLEQEVNALLTDSNFDLNENYILPKSSVLLVLRFTFAEDKDMPCEDQDLSIGVHCLMTSPTTPWTPWYKMEARLDVQKLNHMSKSTSVDVVTPGIRPTTSQQAPTLV